MGVVTLMEMRNIYKKFDAVVALKGASLQVKPGEIRALLGSNGSGKSTLVKVLGGLVKPSSGEIYLDGKMIKVNCSNDARKYGIAVAYQDLSLIPKMSVMDNIMLGHEPSGFFGMTDRKKVRENAHSLLERLKINCGYEDLVGELPTSIQSMIEVAKALSWKPRILLLDEVTASLHHDEVEIIFGLLNELKKSNLATVIVTHRMSEIYRICDTATVLRGGETVTDVELKDADIDEVVFYMTGKRPEKIQRNEHISQDNVETILRVKDIHVLPIVNGISMDIKKGEIIGIGGLQGQGQSEFIRAILGVVPYTKGTVEFKGRNISHISTAAAIKEGMGFISGDRTKEAVFPIRSVAENIYAAESTHGLLFSMLSSKVVKKKASEIVEEFKIKVGSLLNPANSLSGGNQQKMVVGRWMNVKPELLLLDDPTKGVDIGSRQEIHQILFNAASKGMTVIIVSSDNEELLAISDRVYVFYEGNISGILSGSDKTEECFITAMMGLNQHEPLKEGALGK